MSVNVIPDCTGDEHVKSTSANQVQEDDDNDMCPLQRGILLWCTGRSKVILFGGCELVLL